MQGVAIDPNFATNKWVYIYYSPPLNTPPTTRRRRRSTRATRPRTGTAADFAPFKGVMRLSRFKLERQLARRWPASRRSSRSAPTGASAATSAARSTSTAQGNLYLSTGDDTNPFASDGYAPIDERADRNPAFDAQRTAGNTNDLRGKLLRIKVGANGSYTIPKGNLFKPGTA